MTQRALSEKADVARETIWRWETGKQVPESVETVKLVALALGIDLDRALAAAGLHPGQAPVAEDPRLRGFAPNDPVVQRIMSFDVDEDMRSMMLDRHRENLEFQQRRWLEDLERDLRQRGAA
jgi:transcriptional regulator with XRE-family HTH domain